MIVDAEKLTGKHLRATTDVAALIGRRVVIDTPADTSTPWIWITQLDAINASGARHEHLTSTLLQLDCYAGSGGGLPEAKQLAFTARAALIAMPAVRHDEGVVTRTEITGHLRLPDDDFEPARERVVLTVLVHAHPHP